ncbi:MAG TPA: fimbrillin family protein [Prolixibacteraceae bacterium]
MKIFNKNRIAWTISALFLVAVTSCSKDEPAVQSPSKGQILFTGEQAGLTVKSALIANNSDFVADAGSTLKTTINGNITWWIGGTDKTGIYSTQAHTADAGGTEGIGNDPYTAQSSGASSDFTASTPMFWGTANTTHNFYAYYPYSGGSFVAGSVPVALASTQSQLVANDSTHIGGLDFLVATRVEVTSPNNTGQITPTYVHLTYNHLFSIVQFNITGSGNIGGIRLTGTNLALGGALIDIKQDTPTPGVAYTLANYGSLSPTVTVNLATPAPLSTTPTKVYMVIYPGTGIEGSGQCSIEYLNGTWRPAVYKDTPVGGFKRGQKYVVTIDAGAIN